MIEAASNLYSASQLARAAGISKRTLMAELRDTPPRGTIVLAGNPADAWPLADLSQQRQAAIASAAAAHGCRDVHQHISQAPAPWQPPVRLAEIAQSAVEKAAKLHAAMVRTLELRNHPDVTSAQLEARFQEDYRAQFGHGITDRTARALLKRTITRDGFAENWNRLELYLDGNPARKPKAPAPALALTADGEDFRMLHDTMAGFRSATEPTSREREALWLAACECMHSLTVAGADERKARVRLVNYLWRCAGWLARSRNALRVAFQDKYTRWKNRDCFPGALRDGREAKRGIPTAPPIDQALIDNIVACSTFRTGGRVSQAVREVAKMALQLRIPMELADLLSPEAGNKSHVNRRLREAVRHEVRMLQPYTLGSRALDTARASLDRDYANIPAGYCYSADDATLPVYFWIPDGKSWYTLTRGQCIITIDVRTLRILGFSLQPDRNYSSPVIHTNFSRVFADWGVPRLMVLERGIWESSKLITGGARAQTHHQDYEFMPFSWEETKRGFGDLGVEFIHAIRARSKVVERVIGLVQDLMEADPGYCGRDERRDAPQIFKEHKLAVDRRQTHPEKYFYSFAQWEARLVEIFRDYNATVQEGKMLAGMSPDTAQKELQSADPDKRPLLFDETSRHLLAHYRIRKEAGKDGIKITIGKKTWVYRDARLGRDKFKTLLAWFDPAETSSISITDLNMKNPYTVPLSNPVDALDPDAESLAVEMARVAEYEEHGKARYQVLKAHFAPQFRRMVPNRLIVETGQAMRQQKEVLEAERAKNTTRRHSIERRADQLGIPSRIMSMDADAAEGTALMLEAKRARAARLASTAAATEETAS